MQTDRGDTACPTEFVGKEERFLSICTDADLDAHVHRVFLVRDQPLGTTSFASADSRENGVRGKVPGGSSGQGWDSRKDNSSNVQ